jgi:lipopolysaccharide/colanic/teichoic acid biosynthesis glycosyltransferase
MKISAATQSNSKSTVKNYLTSVKTNSKECTLPNESNFIHVYCPNSYISDIESALANHEVTFDINNYAVKSLSNATLCHFQSSELNDEQQAFLISATELGSSVEPLVSYLDRKLGYTEVKLLHSSYFLHQKAFSLLSDNRSKNEKRFLDLLCVILIAIIGLPIGLITALFIKLESPGPIFFKQRRTGQYNTEFEIIKFRSMRNDAEKNGAQWATENDARVTKVGKFIRKTRIDELPQLINVCKGEMSIVGPRPEREVFITKLEKEIPYYRFRHAVKPGITGLAQVKYPYGASTEDAIWKHKFDLFYIKHQNWRMELKILFLTIKTVIFGMGR